MPSRPVRASLLASLAAASLAFTVVAPLPALADHTTAPTSVTIAGSFQSELGCPGDWQPECATTKLADADGDGTWTGTFELPAGQWEYKAAIDGSWTESYGVGSANVAFTTDSAGEVAVSRVLSRSGTWVVLHGACLVSGGARRVAVIVEPAHPARIALCRFFAENLATAAPGLEHNVLAGAGFVDDASLALAS